MTDKEYFKVKFSEMCFGTETSNITEDDYINIRFNELCSNRASWTTYKIRKDCEHKKYPFLQTDEDRHRIVNKLYRRLIDYETTGNRP